MFRGLTVLSAFLACCLSISASTAPAQSAKPGWHPILPGQTVGVLGVFDPSFALGDRGRLYMSFSAVNPNDAQPPPHNRQVSTHLAFSNDTGATWTILDRPANPTRDIETDSGTATWQHEVSALSYDDVGSGMPVWRLMSHHYPLEQGRRGFQHGWIALKSADTFDGLARAKELKLFTGKSYKEHARPPLQGAAVLELHRLHKGLRRCAVITEPALLARPESLYVALSCAEPGLLWAVRHKIVLLACDQPCHSERPEAWRYVATPLAASDTAADKFRYYSAPDIFAKGDDYFLVVTPVSDKPFKDSYNGCEIFRFADIATGEIVRQNGQAKRLARIEGVPGSFNGACAIRDTPALTLLSQLRVENGIALFDILRMTGNSR